MSKHIHIFPSSNRLRVNNKNWKSWHFVETMEMSELPKCSLNVFYKITIGRETH